MRKLLSHRARSPRTAGGLRLYACLLAAALLAGVGLSVSAFQEPAEAAYAIYHPPGYQPRPGSYHIPDSPAVTSPEPEPPSPPTEPPSNPPTNPPTQPPTQPGGRHDTAATVRQLLELVNQDRVRLGLNPLEADPVLMQLAQMKSQDMVDNHYFSHYSPTYGYPFTMEWKAGIRARYMGAENITPASSALEAHSLLMHSPGHRRNILDPRWTDIGIGAASRGRDMLITEMFIGR